LSGEARIAAMPILRREAELYPGDLFEPGAALPEGSQWWVAYTRSRLEKKLARHLSTAKVPFYLPQYEKSYRSGDGRPRRSHLPLFSGYIFFRGDHHERVKALRSNVIVRILDVKDQALLQTELRELWRLQCSGRPIVPHAYIGPGDPVKIVAGPFTGYRGTVLREKGLARLVVSVTLLRQSVSTELEREALTVAPPY